MNRFPAALVFVPLWMVTLSPGCRARRAEAPGPGRAALLHPTPDASSSVRTATDPSGGTIAPDDRPAGAPGRGRSLPAIQPRLGFPLNGLTEIESARFRLGRAAFRRVFYVEDGLGPIHNLHSCVGCHSNPIGGTGTSTITLFGRVDGDRFDDLADWGGPMLQAESVNDSCSELVPHEANWVANRLTPSLLGAGLLEAIPDRMIEDWELQPPLPVSGRSLLVLPLEAPAGARERVARFGFKNHLGATLAHCSAVSAFSELGLTSRYFPVDLAPNEDAARGASCDTIPDPELRPDPDGFDVLDRITDFQRLLSPPPQTPRSGHPGEAVFLRIGCGSCHRREFRTDDVLGHGVSALRNQLIRPYTDLLLHDMGAQGDGIAQGGAGRWEMRTPPLWGFRIRFPVWHDGRIAGATVRERAERSIELHEGESEFSREAYRMLSPADQELLIGFLDSLGRVEFDYDGDNDVDVADWKAFLSDPATFLGAPCPPEHRCAVFDVDQSGSVDLVDVALLQRAFSGPDYGSTMVVP